MNAPSEFVPVTVNFSLAASVHNFPEGQFFAFEDQDLIRYLFFFRGILPLGDGLLFTNAL